MMKTVSKSLQQWYQAYDARQKLQHAYLASAIALVVAAGIIGLINYDLGQRILLGAFVCIVVFVVNAVAWALLHSFVLMRIPQTDAKSASRPITRKK